MKRLILLILVSQVADCHAQQIATYTQFTFNKAGLNPAASGTLMDQKYFFSAGLRRQWTGFERSPRQNFVNFSYTLRPPRSYRYWQNFSFYADNDEAGMLGNNSAYLGYTFHLLLKKKYVLSFGAYAGARLFQRKTGGFDPDDPAVKNSRTSAIALPDFIPGIRYSDHRTFIGLSVKQISITRQRHLNGGSIGNSSLLQPSVYIDYGRKIAITDQLLALPAFVLYIPVIGIPSFEASLMYYYGTRIGAGLSIRNNSFASAILQVRFLQNLSAGFSYSYPLNPTRFTAGNTFELMIGIVPYGMESKLTGSHSVARCPDLSF